MNNNPLIRPLEASAVRQTPNRPLMSTATTALKQRGRPFRKGHSGNPRGRPLGARNAATLAAERLLDGECEALTRKAVELALSGDGAALRLCMERILPPRRDRPVRFRLPALSTAGDAVTAMAAIVAAVADGDLTPAEAGELSAMVGTFVKAIEIRDLESRVRVLEGEFGRSRGTEVVPFVGS